MTKLDDRIEKLKSWITKVSIPGILLPERWQIMNKLKRDALPIIRDLRAENKRLREALGIYAGWKGSQLIKRILVSYGFAFTDEVIDELQETARAALKGDGDG